MLNLVTSFLHIMSRCPQGVPETPVAGSLRRVLDASHDFGAHILLNEMDSLHSYFGLIAPCPAKLTLSAGV